MLFPVSLAGASVVNLIVIFLYADTAAAISKFLILDIVVESLNKKCVV